MGSLLEVGTGFHPELTGRENVYLNGTLLGMRRKEIKERFDAIVDFAGTERFLDTQVKRYSTGMYIRLAFAVAAHLDSEILVVDEVLAVGDSDFQAKCLRKMREVARDGRTVLLVSHQLQTVSDLCTSALYLDAGHLVLHGTVKEAMEEYKRSFARSAPVSRRPPTGPGTGELRFVEAKVTDDITRPGEDVVVEFAVGANPDFGNRYHLSCFVNNEDGHAHRPVRLPGGRLLARSVDRRPGHAAAADTVAQARGLHRRPVHHAGGHAADIWEQACHFQVLPVTPYPHPTTPDGTDRGVVYPRLRLLPELRSMATHRHHPAGAVLAPQGQPAVGGARGPLPLRRPRRDPPLPPDPARRGLGHPPAPAHRAGLRPGLRQGGPSAHGGHPPPGLRLRRAAGLEPVQRHHHPGLQLAGGQPRPGVQGLLPPHAGARWPPPTRPSSTSWCPSSS